MDKRLSFHFQYLIRSLSIRRWFVGFLLILSGIYTGKALAQGTLYLVEGMPSKNFRSVFNDNFGYLWICSADGLFRWDGKSCNTYYHTKSDTSTVSDNFILVVFEDSKKRLWIGSAGGLDLYNRDSDNFRRIHLGASSSGFSVNDIKEDAQGKIWLATSNGVYQYDPDRNTSVIFRNKALNQNTLCNDEAYTLLFDSGNNLWIGTFNGLDKYMTQTGTFVHYNTQTNTVLSNKIRSLLSDEQGRIWVGYYDRGISVLNAKGEVLFHPEINIKGYSFKKNPTVVSSMYQDNQKKIWVGLENLPLCTWDKFSSAIIPVEFSPYNHSLYNCMNVWGVVEDRFHNLWMATKDGLYYTNQKKNNFRFYSKRDDLSKGLNHAWVSSFLESRSGKIWVGTDGGGISQFDPVSGSFKHLGTAQGLSSNSVLDIKEDRYGTVWIATWAGGLMQFDPRTLSLRHHGADSKNKNALPYNNIKALLPDDTLLWIGTHGEGLAVYDLKNKRFPDRMDKRRFPFDMRAPLWINHLYKDKKGRLWISTTRGLYKLHKNKLEAYLPGPQKTTLNSSTINMVAEDEHGQIWIAGKPGGVERFDEATNSFVHMSEQLEITTKPQALLFDHAGDLWITSDDGMICFTPSKGTSQIFTKEDGLQSNAFYMKSIYQTKGGKVYIGGLNGFNTFLPGTVKNAYIPASCYFTDLLIYPESNNSFNPDSVLKRSILTQNEIRIAPHENSFTVLFASINLYSPNKTRYAYQLAGMQTQWIYVGSDQKATFTNLDPGDYKLKIKFIDANGTWKEFDRYLRLKVLPPWWKTWWFRLFAILTGVGLLFLITYWRIKAAQKQNEILTREVELRTSELTEANAVLQSKTEKIVLQNERLEEYNAEVKRQSEKIIKQQELILEKNQELEKSVRELDVANSTKDRFFSIIAHDLKNPAGTLYSMASLLKDRYKEFDPSELEQYIGNIERSSFSIYALLINLLDWAKTQSNTIQYKPENLNCKELLHRNLQLLSSQIKQKNIQVFTEANSSHFLVGDYYMVDTILRNILANAVKFTPKNGEIWIRMAENEGLFTMAIQDSGVGMTAEEVSTLFRIDQRHFTKGTEGETGSGLGLVITREFMDYHQGEIRINSNKGKGTTFELVFPVSGTTPTVYDRPASLNDSVPDLNYVKQEDDFNLSESKLARLKGNRILLVDDNRELLLHLRKLLSGTFEIFEAEDGEQGLEKAREYQPAIIISDMVMPVMDGLEFCKNIKSAIHTSHIPVVVLTSQQDQISQLQGYEAGADVYLTKPIHHQMLYYVLYNILHNQDMIKQKFALSQKVYPEDVSVNKLDDAFLKTIIQYIEKNISDPGLDYKKLCEVTALSKTLLYSKLKTLTGQSVHEFIKSVRLKKSLELLAQTRMNVNEVAFEVGFNSTSYFIRCFVEQHGMSPKDYQNKQVSHS